ncbi:unnamed protein product [Schistocephalus solidus]|uniref:Uncharacterized protein n=1 Tax=Schistocephalus solidus TaxID=70667 RepID=A0A183SXQ7_SCHSO|nr:unnamed protein product [Schistocephalus solidus]
MRWPTRGPHQGQNKCRTGGVAAGLGAARAKEPRLRQPPTPYPISGPIDSVLTQGIDNPRGNRPERRTALVTRELARYKVEIAGLSETLFSGQGQLEEVGAGYTFFCSGRPRAERRDAGVVLAIRNDIVGRLSCLPQGINDRLMSLRLPLR